VSVAISDVGEDGAVGLDTEIARATLRRVTGRLLPLLVALFLCNWIDRTSVAIAALQMNRDLHFSAAAYGLGSGIFFIGYALLEVPSTLMLARVGARRWIARIAISWGVVASAMVFVRTPTEFYVIRFLLGVAEAGFLPGIIYYLTLWFPARGRGTATGRFMIAAPLAGIVGNAVGGWILGLDGFLGVRGWEWLFLVEGAPSVVLGFLALMFLTDRPEGADWLSEEQRTWLLERLRRDRIESAAAHELTVFGALAHPTVWLLAVTNFLMAVPLWAYAFWAPLFVRDTLHTTNLTTGLILAGVAGVAAAAMILSGVASDRTGERCLHAGAGALLTAAGCAGAALLPNPLWRVVALATVEVGVRSYITPFLCLPPMLLRGTAAAAGIALVNTIFSLGGFVGPSLMGWFESATGSTNGAFLILATLALCAAVLCVGMRRHPAFTPTFARSATCLGGESGERNRSSLAG
jgi:ACS family tartrate transporter-like MFS transporter